MSNSNLITHITLDEIGLEGLDGITLESKIEFEPYTQELGFTLFFIYTGLWKRLSIRLKYQYPLNEHFCAEIWAFIVKQTCLHYYELAEPRSIIKTFDRSEIADPDAQPPVISIPLFNRDLNNYVIIYRMIAHLLCINIILLI